MRDSPTLLEQAGLKERFIRCLVPITTMNVAVSLMTLTSLGVMWTGNLFFFLPLTGVPFFICWRMASGWRVDEGSLHVLLWPKWISLPIKGLQLDRPDTYRHHLFGLGRAIADGKASRLIPIPAPWTLTESLLFHHLNQRGAAIHSPWDFEMIFDPARKPLAHADDQRDFGHFRLSGAKFQRMVACQVHWEVDLAGAEHRIELREGRFGLQIRQLLILEDGRHLCLQLWSTDTGPFDHSLALELAARGVRSIICEASDRQDVPLGLKEPSL